MDFFDLLSINPLFFQIKATIKQRFISALQIYLEKHLPKKRERSIEIEAHHLVTKNTKINQCGLETTAHPVIIETSGRA